MEKKNCGFGVVIALMTVVILGLSGYLVYDKVLTKLKNNEGCPKCEEKVCNPTIESKSLSDKYTYSGSYGVADMNIDLELKSDKTFVLNLSHAADALTFKGIYTLYGNELKLYAETEPVSNTEYNVKESADSFDCIYDASSNQIIVNKWNKISTEGQNIKRETETKFNQTLSKK